MDKKRAKELESVASIAVDAAIKTVTEVNRAYADTLGNNRIGVIVSATVITDLYKDGETPENMLALDCKDHAGDGSDRAVLGRGVKGLIVGSNIAHSLQVAHVVTMAAANVMEFLQTSQDAMLQAQSEGQKISHVDEIDYGDDSIRVSGIKELSEAYSLVGDFTKKN